MVSQAGFGLLRGFNDQNPSPSFRLCQQMSLLPNWGCLDSNESLLTNWSIWELIQKGDQYWEWNPQPKKHIFLFFPDIHLDHHKEVGIFADFGVIVHFLKCLVDAKAEHSTQIDLGCFQPNCGYLTFSHVFTPYIVYIVYIAYIAIKNYI